MTTRECGWCRTAGAIDGFRCHLVLAPDRGLGIAILANLDRTPLPVILANILVDDQLGLKKRDWHAAAASAATASPPTSPNGSGSGWPDGNTARHRRSPARIHRRLRPSRLWHRSGAAAAGPAGVARRDEEARWNIFSTTPSAPRQRADRRPGFDVPGRQRGDGGGGDG
ncbi:MAG: hypothetical protein U0736_03275 [Gemmataceae bacterium]